MTGLAHWEKGRRARCPGEAPGPCHAYTYLSGADPEQPLLRSRAVSTARSLPAARGFGFARVGIRLRKCRLNDHSIASYSFCLPEIVVRDVHQLSLR